MNLREISVYINDKLVVELSKKMQEPDLMDVVKMVSPKKLFHLISIDVRDVKLDIKYKAGEQPISIFFRIASGNVDVKVNKTFSAEMERTTKKTPPSKTII